MNQGVIRLGVIATPIPIEKNEKIVTTSEITIPAEEQEQPFQSGPVFTIIGGHFIHDTFTAFIAPLLPLVIEKLSLSLTLAGALTAFMQLPAILNPFIGYLADKFSLRYFVIFAPAATATLIGMIGLSPNYISLALLFVLIGIAVAAFHAPTPAMIARVSGSRVGFGMSLYMASGELGRTVGPLVAVSAVAAWGLEGIYRLVVIGWASSGILLWRFRSISSSEYRKKAIDLSSALPMLRSFFLPVIFIVLSRAFLTVSVTTYLPTFLNFEGSSLAQAGIMLAVLEGGGVVGALSSGTASDKFGRKPILLAAFVLSSIFLFIFLQVQGWLLIPVLILLGFFSLSPQPVLLAMVQDHLPNHRAAANGLYMSISFLLRSLVLVLVGIAGDAWGLRITFTISGVISILSIIPILLLPGKPDSDKTPDSTTISS
jgi:FSR family fosmidomycin resistance protein-like MFS transporter